MPQVAYNPRHPHTARFSPLQLSNILIVIITYPVISTYPHRYRCSPDPASVAPNAITVLPLCRLYRYTPPHLPSAAWLPAGRGACKLNARYRQERQNYSLFCGLWKAALPMQKRPCKHAHAQAGAHTIVFICGAQGARTHMHTPQ